MYCEDGYDPEEVDGLFLDACLVFIYGNQEQPWMLMDGEKIIEQFATLGEVAAYGRGRLAVSSS